MGIAFFIDIYIFNEPLFIFESERQYQCGLVSPAIRYTEESRQCFCRVYSALLRTIVIARHEAILMRSLTNPK